MIVPSRTNVSIEDKLKRAGLRPTRQRCALAALLFGKGDWHVTAEALHEEALGNSVPVSLATVYNTLHQFTDAGLLRSVAVDGAKTYFDTNTRDHHHFYNERSGQLTDIPEDHMDVINVPEAPEGMEVARVDIVVRIRDTET